MNRIFKLNNKSFILVSVRRAEFGASHQASHVHPNSNQSREACQSMQRFQKNSLTFRWEHHWRCEDTKSRSEVYFPNLTSFLADTATPPCHGPLGLCSFSFLKGEWCAEWCQEMLLVFPWVRQERINIRSQRLHSIHYFYGPPGKYCGCCTLRTSGPEQWFRLWVCCYFPFRCRYFCKSWFDVIKKIMFETRFKISHLSSTI